MYSDFITGLDWIKLKELLIIQWENFFYFVIIFHMPLFGQKDFQENNLEQYTITLQYSSGISPNKTY